MENKILRAIECNGLRISFHFDLCKVTPIEKISEIISGSNGITTFGRK